MKRQRTDEPVDLSSDESSSSDADESKKTLDGSVSKQFKETICEDTLMRKAKMYQEYMKEVPLPTTRSSRIPFTSWTELAISMKQLYDQPLHYLTNTRLKQWDQMRFVSDEENTSLASIIHPRKAEATIWLMEEVHRLTTSHHYIFKLWLADPMYYAFIDPVFQAFPKRLSGNHWKI